MFYIHLEPPILYHCQGEDSDFKHRIHAKRGSEVVRNLSSARFAAAAPYLKDHMNPGFGGIRYIPYYAAIPLWYMHEP